MKAPKIGMHRLNDYAAQSGITKMQPVGSTQSPALKRVMSSIHGIDYTAAGG
jgi:hypothetical protein